MKLGNTINIGFSTADDTGALKNCSSTPTGTIFKNGVSDALAVTVTNPSTGHYNAAFTPTTGAGFAIADRIRLWIAGTIVNTLGTSISCGNDIWEDVIENPVGADGKALISTDAQDLSASLDVNTKKVGGTTQTARDLGLALPAAAAGAVSGLVTNSTVTAYTAKDLYDISAAIKAVSDKLDAMITTV